MERFRDRIPQFADDNTSDDTLWRSLDPSIEADVDKQTNAERIQRALVMSMMGENGNDEIGSCQASSIEQSEGSATGGGRLQRALVMSMMDENDNDEIGSFQATPIELGEGNEIDEKPLQRSLVMSMIDENGCGGMVASEEDFV